MFNESFTSLELTAQEATFFGFQPRDFNAIPLDVVKHQYELLVKKPDGDDYKWFRGTIVNIKGKPYAHWKLDGSFSKDLYDKFGGTGLTFMFYRVINNALYLISSGTISVTRGPDEIKDYDDGPDARYLDLIVGYFAPGSPTPKVLKRESFIYDKSEITPIAGSNIPVNLTLPTISGTPQVGSPLTVTNGSWSNSPASYARQWRVGGVEVSGATNATYTPSIPDLGKTITATVIATNAEGYASATTAATSTVLQAPVTPPAVGSFTAVPTIAGATSRVEGDVFGYTPGTVANGTVGEVALFKDNVRQATLTAGSGAFDFGAGSYFVRSYIAGSSVYADSTAVTVAAIVAKPITPPAFYFDQARVAGTNPPEVFWNDVDDTVFATDTLEIEWTTVGSTFTKLLTMNISSRSLHDFTVAEWSNLSAGAFSVRGRYRRVKDVNGKTIPEVISSWSAALTDTLSAKGMTPAATIWDIQNKSNQMKIENTQYLNARGSNVGAAQPVAVTIARSDKRFAEFKIIGDHGTNRGSFNLGIIPSATVIDPGSYSGPTGFVSVTVAASSFAAGDIYTLLVTPQVGSTAGQIVLNKNGVQVGTASHSITDYKLVYNCAREAEVRLNTGKEAFSFAPTDTSFIRYN